MSPAPATKGDPLSAKSGGWVSWLMWGVAILMVALLLYLVWQRTPGNRPEPAGAGENRPEPAALEPPAEPAYANLPAFSSGSGVQAIVRVINTHTIIPTRERTEVVEYTIEKGDSIFGIAQRYKLKPETILWANYDTLNDDPHMISIGLNLKIPATDGVYYQWKEGDAVDEVAARFKTAPEKILSWPGNHLDLTNPEIEPGAFVMLPDGWREFKQWVVPTIWRPKAGTNRSIAGGCEIPEGGALGSGSFVWPAGNHSLSGNDYWDGHLALDIAAGTGAPVYASDSGVVVYAASIGGGYGNMVMIDHGNGYHTLYAHLSQIVARCGQSVFQGNIVGYAGSSGNSTGPHLHFEVRYLGGFINPWFVLP